MFGPGNKDTHASAERINPFAAPESEIGAPPPLPGDETAWRFGDRLVVLANDSVLPDRCVKTNQPADGYQLKRTLYWHAPGWYLLILINLIVYAIAHMIVRKKAVLYIGLSPTARRRRWLWIMVAWLSPLLAITFAIMTSAFGLDLEDTLPLPVVLLIVGILGLLLGVVMAQPISAARITNQYALIKGVCPEFLADLPDWPHRDVL